jgi:3-dehydro-L-gulonate 2-dehydrogenase
VRIDIESLQETFHSILISVGMDAQSAATSSRIFAETTLDGVFSHGINRFPRFINDIREGTVNLSVKPLLTSSMHALEQWDGQQGPGVLNALHCTDRSMELARQFGVGCVGLRNTNHWMRGGTYGWRAAEEGFLFMGWTNTSPNMPPWGGDAAALGNNPFILAIPRPEGHVVLDMAMSQYSYGTMEWHQKCGTHLPEFGGYNHENQLTRDPSQILETGRILPIGLWKGSALSLVLDLAAAILSGGKTTSEIGELPEETQLSQVFISINIKKHFDEEQLGTLIERTLDFNRSLNAAAQYPGERSLRNRKRHLKEGIEIPDEIWNEIIQLQSG